MFIRLLSIGKAGFLGKSLLSNFFFYHNPHHTDIKNKKYYNHQVLFYISSTWEKAKKYTKTIWNRNKNDVKNEKT